MKKLGLFILFIAVSWTANGQLLTLTSKDSLNGKPVKEFYTTAWLKYSGFMDFQGIPNESAMHLPSIPTQRDSVPADPQFNADLYQTRIKFASRFQTKKVGEIFSYIETDFYGNGGGGLRLRLAYVTFLNWRIGQAWSAFVDEEAWPNIIDFDGPSTGVWVRSVQVAYNFNLKPNTDLMVSVETPSTDYGRYLFIDTLIKPALQGIPDLVSHIQKSWSRGHFQLGVVGRVMEYKDAKGERAYILGGGMSASGSLRFLDEDKFIYQMTAGTGISRYLVSFGGGGWDAVPDDKGYLETVPIYGGYVGYQHFWKLKGKSDGNEPSKLSSTVVYGYVYLKNPLGQPSPSLLTGSYASANVYWNIVGPLTFALEGIYGYRTDEYESHGSDTRIQFALEYNF